MPKRLRRSIELFPRLAERRRQAGGTLSGGEQQMLAIGRAMMNFPKLLMLDEPSLGLSPVLAELVFERLARSSGRARPFCWSSRTRPASRWRPVASSSPNGRVVLAGERHSVAGFGIRAPRLSWRVIAALQARELERTREERS